jgi:hypothetical protein
LALRASGVSGSKLRSSFPLAGLRDWIIGQKVFGGRR